MATFYQIVIYVIADCNSRDFSIIHSPLTFKIRYGYELGVWVVVLSIILMDRLNSPESAVFLYCRLSLFLRGSIFQII